ncbi:pseudouridine synthase [Asticcacaulis sp. EMRT-3]|uniref:pseudouridine synthase n=1 Tax=Asticcacaulis sp. EMRT-3 TaxID=3040349 RepID=UPI0024AFEE6F|nr:pseudouridine synthase [Asticcacaulis sp. EMRT-3]MDI7774922.1 pseudouridine synthase [Asticcacaulis sp. EMRT-3]
MTEDSNAGERDEAETPPMPTQAELKAQKDAQDMADGHLYIPQELRDAREAAGKPERKKPPKKAEVKATGERIAKVLARAGLASRREVERLIGLGKIAVNGRILETPAVLVKPTDVITVEGQVIGKAEPTRLWRYHKPVGLVTTHRDPEGRSTVFDKLPEGLPRVISVGRLDLNSEGLLLLTNDGELARSLEKPSSGWVRRYRARALGHTTQSKLDRLRDGTTVEGVIYGPMEATLDKMSEKADGRANVWLTVAITEGKNREVRKVLESIGLKVNRLIRLAYGPFLLGNLEPGEAEEVGPRVIRELLGDVVELRHLPPEGASQTRSEGRPARAGGDAPAGRRGGGDRFGAGRGDKPAFGPAFGEGKPAAKVWKPRSEMMDKREFKERDFDQRPRFEGDGEARDRKPSRDYGDRPVIKKREYGDRPQSDRPQGDRPAKAWMPKPERGARPERPARSGSRDGGRDFKPRQDLGEAGAYARAKAEFGPQGRAPRNAGAPEGERPKKTWTPRAEGGERGPRRDFGDKKPYGDKPRGDRPQGDRPQGERPAFKKPWAPREEGAGGERKTYGDRPKRDFGDKKPYGAREGGERKSYGDKPRSDRPQGDRPQGERPAFKKPWVPREEGAGGERKAYGDRPKRDFGDKKPYAAREGGERKSYGDKPRSDRPTGGGFQRSSEGRPAGGKPSFGGKPAGARPSGPRKPRG